MSPERAMSAAQEIVTATPVSLWNRLPEEIKETILDEVATSDGSLIPYKPGGTVFFVKAPDFSGAKEGVLLGSKDLHQAYRAAIVRAFLQPDITIGFIVDNLNFRHVIASISKLQDDLPPKRFAALTVENKIHIHLMASHLGTGVNPVSYTHLTLPTKRIV